MELWDILDEKGHSTGIVKQRGEELLPGEFHLVVFAFITNSKGELLISRRTMNKTFPGSWEITGGAAILGDDSRSAVLREIKEELGLTLSSDQGRFIGRFSYEGEHSYFADLWHFQAEVKPEEICCQEEEVSEAKWAKFAEVEVMIERGVFIRNPFVLDCLRELESTMAKEE